LSTYFPSVNNDKVETLEACVIKNGTALKLKASRDLVDEHGNTRAAGETWLVRKLGSYLPGAYEEDLGFVTASVLTSSNALILKASCNFTDCYNNHRKAGDSWLIKDTDSSMHIVDVNEQLVKRVNATVLTTDQFCYVTDPYDHDKKTNNFGTRVVRRGPTAFFLYPNEGIDLQNHKTGIRNISVLSCRDGVLIKALQKIGDKNPGDRWMEYGPQAYLPPSEVEIIREVQQLPLDKNEGIYVRNTKTGQCKAVIGENYMLSPDEERYSLELPALTKKLLSKDPRFVDDKLITCNCPFNACVQVFNYLKKNQ